MTLGGQFAGTCHFAQIAQLCNLTPKSHFAGGRAVWSNCASVQFDPRGQFAQIAHFAQIARISGI